MLADGTVNPSGWTAFGLINFAKIKEIVLLVLLLILLMSCLKSSVTFFYKRKIYHQSIATAYTYTCAVRT